MAGGAGGGVGGAEIGLLTPKELLDDLLAGESPKAGPAGKTTGAWICREGESVQRAMVWDAWRKVRVVRKSAV
jgi:hypothetical protein